MLLDDLQGVAQDSSRPRAGAPRGGVDRDALSRRRKPIPIPLSRTVISCSSAAEAKGVSLERELKSLVIVYHGERGSGRGEHGSGIVVAHVRGNRRLSLRAVKRTLKARQAMLAAPSDLRDHDLQPGTIHPFHPNLRSMKHLVSHEVFTLSWVTTNAGQFGSYVVFEPRLLEELDPYVDDFEE